MCPGKNVAGRDGKTYNRCIEQDVTNFRQTHNIGLIVNLLNDYELRSIGVNVGKYESACIKNEIEFFKYPIIEMAPPEDLPKFDVEVIQKILKALSEG